MKIFKQLMIMTGLFALLVNIPANAFDGAILKGIEIDSPDKQGYRIIIRTDKDVPIKKYITAADKVVLELENVRPAQFVNTLYNNATEVDHVIVQPFPNNKVRIFLQGMNIAAGKIILDTRDEVLGFINKPEIPKAEQIPEIIAPKPRTITSSGSIFIDLSDKTVDKVKSVTPLTSYAEASRNNFKSVQNSIAPEYSSNNIFEASIFDWILRFAMLAAIIIAGIKFFNKPEKVEINLSSEKSKAREMDLLRAAEAKKELLTKSLGAPLSGRKSVNASISQYGIKEYQNSQLPPRKNYTAPARPTKPLLKQQKTSTQTAARQASATKVTKQQTQKARENFDGTKFLETMAAIYQKSGRDDLASGIRQNILQKQVKQVG